MSSSESHDDLLLVLLQSVKTGDRRRIRHAAAAAAAGGCSASVVDAIVDLGQPATLRPPQDADRTMARGLEIALFAEVGEGVAPLSPEAERHVGIGFAGSLADAIAHVTTLSTANTALTTLLRQARVSGSSNATIREGAIHWRVHAYQHETGLRVALVPLGERDAREIQTLATINHEMANGITALASLAAIARHPASSPAFVADSLRRIERTAEETLGAVQSSRNAMQRQLSEAPIAFDAAPLMRELVENFTAVAKASKVSLVSRIGDELLASVRPGDLRSIVWNLVKNALEAAGAGGRVRVGAATAPDTVRIVVDDDGPGMSAEVQRRAFEPYYTTKKSGAGLGLPLVRHLVTRLGGELILESEPGHGTRVVVSLPLAGETENISSGVRRRHPFRGVTYALHGPRSERLELPLSMQGAERVNVERLDSERVDVVFVDADTTHAPVGAWRSQIRALVWVGAAGPPTTLYPSPKANAWQPGDASLPAAPNGDELIQCLAELFEERAALIVKRSGS